MGSEGGAVWSPCGDLQGNLRWRWTSHLVGLCTKREQGGEEYMQLSVELSSTFLLEDDLSISHRRKEDLQM
jgi:hypothetical protein